MAKYLLFLSGFVLLVNACQSSQNPGVSLSRVIAVDSTIEVNAEVEAYLSPLRDSVEAVMNETIGYTTSQLKASKPGTPLSNFVADLILEAAEDEISKNNMASLPMISVINIKGLRAPLPKGNITIRNIYALMPFENYLVILKHNGAQIRELFQHMGESNGDGLSGGSFTFKGNKVVNPRINENPVEDGRQYYVAAPDYLASGGDHYTVFSKASEKHESSRKIRDLIIIHIKKLDESGNPVNPDQDKRIILK